MKYTVTLVLLAAVFAVTFESVSSFECSSSGWQADPGNCKGYHICFDDSHGNFMDIPMDCPDNMAFDPVNLYCSSKAARTACIG